MYHNEKESGKAISDFLASDANTESLRREDIHFTSKLASNSAYETARKAIKKSVKEAGLGYIDLFLLHSPYGGKQARLDSWRAVEDAINDGEVKIGGVSNYGVKHVSRPWFPSFCFSCLGKARIQSLVRTYTQDRKVVVVALIGLFSIVMSVTEHSTSPRSITDDMLVARAIGLQSPDSSSG